MQSITLQTSDTVITAGDVLGRLNYAASAEADGSAAILIAGSIYVQAEGSFQSSSNPSAIVFATAAADASSAVDRLKITDGGNLVPITDTTYSLGSPSLNFKELHSSSGTLEYLSLETSNTMTPQFNFTGSGVNDTPINMEVRSSFQSATGSGTALLFQGTQGQLFSITDNLSSGTIFNVSDITGLPMLEVTASGDVQIGEFARYVGIGSGIPEYDLDVSASGRIQKGLVLTDYVPATTTNALYNDGGTLKFNGSAVAGSAYDDTYVSGVAAYASGQAIENETEIASVSGWAATTHPTISAASSSDNSGRTYIQDITLDSNGHVTGLTTATETVTDTNTTYTAGNGLSLSSTTFSLDDPINLSELDESTDAIDDKILLWDESASTWKYMTLDNLQDAIDTTGAGGISNVVEDTTPQLGGSLDAQNNEITDVGRITFNGDEIEIGSYATSTLDGVSIGYLAGSGATNHRQSVFIGSQAGQSSDGQGGPGPSYRSDIYIGQDAGKLSDGIGNIGIGGNALYAATGNYNIEITYGGSTIIGNASNSSKLNIGSVIVGDTSSKLFAIGNVTSSDLTPDATLEVKPNATTDVGLIVQAAASHSASLQEWQNSSETKLLAVGPDGGLEIPSNTPSTTTNKLYNDGSNLNFGTKVIIDSTNVNTGLQYQPLGGGLNVTGLTTTEFAAATLVTESDAISSNDNDTTIPTSAAVKDYVDGQGFLTSETSHADVVVDGDFGSQGIMLRGASAGTYSILTDNSSNWNTAYGWGDHSSAGYLTAHPTISAASSSDNSGRTYIQDIILDSNGHVTGLTTATETVTDTQLSQEQVEDYAGNLISTGGTKTGITVTYQDSTNDVDFVVGGLTTTEFAAATLVTAAEGIGSNNNDTTIPTSAAVKAYADSVAGSPGGSDTQIQFNDGGSFGGDADLVWNKTTNALTITGSLNATTKSFLIDHPSKPGMKLQYASLEGPENGVYVRGTTDKGFITLPDYWRDLVHNSSITVTLTPVGQFQPLFVEQKNNREITVGGVCGYYDYVVYGERKDVDKLEVEW